MAREGLEVSTKNMIFLWVYPNLPYTMGQCMGVFSGIKGGWLIHQRVSVYTGNYNYNHDIVWYNDTYNYI